MTPEAAAEWTPIPQGVRTLLEAFRRVYHQPDIRLLTETEAGWVSWYGTAGDATGDWASASRAAIVVADAAPLAVEVRGGCATAAATAFLADALAEALLREREARSAARELTERYEEINLLYGISEILGSVLSLTEAATGILAEVVDVLGAKRASLWVYRPDEERLHLAAAVGEDGLRGPIPASDTASATAWVFREKQVLNLERGSALPTLPLLEPRPRGTEAFLSVPISYTPPGGAARTVGVLTLVGRKTNVRYSAGDARLLSAIASQIGAALEAQRLVQESLRQERLVRELELAHDLQLKLLPDPGSIESPLQIAARCVPAESVGGDFYQLFRLTGDRVGVMIGDVSSHGFPAALIMTLVMSAVGIYAPESGAPGETLRRVHRALADELESTEMYLSLFYAVLDPAGGQLTFANAGHPQAFRIDRDGGVQRLGATGPPLGLLPSPPFEERTVPWRAGDLLLAFTDGLSDTLAGARGTRLGESSLVQAVAARRTEPLDAVIDHVFSLSEHGGAGLPADDRTLLLVRG
jgi:sigma-B regulation protein RsbU (phosphoserine phosphatase)